MPQFNYEKISAGLAGDLGGENAGWEFGMEKGLTGEFHKIFVDINLWGTYNTNNDSDTVTNVSRLTDCGDKINRQVQMFLGLPTAEFKQIVGFKLFN